MNPEWYAEGLAWVARVVASGAPVSVRIVAQELGLAEGQAAAVLAGPWARVEVREPELVGWECERCGREFERSQARGNHRKWCSDKVYRVSSPEEGGFACPRCGEEFARRGSLGTHLAHGCAGFVTGRKAPRRVVAPCPRCGVVSKLQLDHEGMEEGFCFAHGSFLAAPRPPSGEDVESVTVAPGKSRLRKPTHAGIRL